MPLGAYQRSSDVPILHARHPPGAPRHLLRGHLDDVIVYSANPEEHVTHVRTILAVLRQHQLYAKIQKCEFSKEEMTFVGFLVSKSGIGMDPAKVAAI